jgi:hypothetical protein
VLALVLGAMASWGCSGSDATSAGVEGVAADHGAPAEPNSLITVKGSISAAGEGSTALRLAGRDVLTAARKVRVSALEEGGNLRTLSVVPVDAASGFQFELPKIDLNATVIAQVLNDVGDVLGSGIIKGIVPAIQAFIIMAPIDTVTSFKTEVLTNLAKGNIPGVAQYLNVINTFVDAEFANSVAALGVITGDITSLIGKVGDAVTAANDVMVRILASGGIDVDKLGLAELPATVFGGLKDGVNAASADLVTGASDLLAALKAAAGQAGDAIDRLLFNAIVGGGAAFKTSMKGGSPSYAGSGAELTSLRSAFKSEADMVSHAVVDMFSKAGAGDSAIAALTKAGDTLLSRAAGAASIADLSAARLDFVNALLMTALGGNKDPMARLLEPVVRQLASAIQTIVPGGHGIVEGVLDALSKLAAGIEALAPKVPGALGPARVKALLDSLALAQSLIVP